jgi:hypothetical protein
VDVGELMNKHAFTEGLRAEASRILMLIFGLRQVQERERQRLFDVEQTQLNGMIQGPLDPDQVQQRQQQMDMERGRLNGFVRGPDDPDVTRTRLDLLRDLHTEATGYRFQQASQAPQRAVAAEMAALQHRMQAQQLAQQEWQVRSQQYGQGR